MIEHEVFGEQARLHHIGLAVQSIREVSPSSDVVVDEIEGVSMAFVRIGGVTIELLEPLGADSPIASGLSKGQKLLHLCYEVKDLDHALALCRPAGFHRIRGPREVPVYEHRRVAWVFSNQYGLVELLECS